MNVMDILDKECRRLEEVREAILRACERAGRNPEEVTLIGASKTVGADILRKFYQCGLRRFGENRAQEFLRKYEALTDLDIEWHFIGRLQTNKVKYLIGKVCLIHSLDRRALADEIQKRASKAGIVQEVLIEVNVGEEETKGGVSPEYAQELLEYALSLSSIRVTGLMTVPPYFEDPEKVRPYFAKLRELRDNLSAEVGIALPHLSMGMSGDFEVAIEEGATIVRVGTKLFGSRS